MSLRFLTGFGTGFGTETVSLANPSDRSASPTSIVRFGWGSSTRHSACSFADEATIGMKHISLPDTTDSSQEYPLAFTSIPFTLIGIVFLDQNRIFAGGRCRTISSGPCCNEGSILSTRPYCRICCRIKCCGTSEALPKRVNC